MLNIKPPKPPKVIESANPLALATLTLRKKNGEQVLVEWTDVRKVRWTSNGRQYIRHVLDPILKEHLGGPGWLKGTTGLGLGLEPHDKGCRLVIDVPVDPTPTDLTYDMHVEG
jgi:hypothetical protein